MEQETKKKLEATIAACADKAGNAKTALEAMQYTQAAVNASNVIIGLEMLDRKTNS